MLRVRAAADGLRSTPSGLRGRDAAIFPEAAAAHARWGCPSSYYLAVGPARVILIHDEFHLPQWLGDALRARYAAYLDTWQREGPRSWPRHGVARSAFRGTCSVTIRREDAREWIGVLRDAALWCFNPMEREQWLRKLLATLSPGP
jgi:hypothetical protein